jgi:hypothetical protein
LGRQAGLRDNLVDALRDRMPLPPMSVEEAVVINLGMEFFQTNRVSQDTFDIALEQFGSQEDVKNMVKSVPLRCGSMASAVGA